MNFLVFGAGAVGTYIGGSLVMAGHRVCFLARPDSAQRIRRSGLRIDLRAAARPRSARSGWWGEEVTVDASRFAVATSPIEAMELGAFEAAIFALKTYDAASAMTAVRPVVAQMPPVLCLTNGVETEEVIGGALGSHRVIAGVLTTPVGRRSTGDVVVERPRGIGLDENANASPGVAAALNQAGLNARLYPDAKSMKWSKLLLNLLCNPTSAILNMRPPEILAHPGLYRLEIRILRECLSVMKVLGLRAVNLPGAPVQVLAALARLPAVLSAPFLRRAVGMGRGAKMPSFHVDLRAGRKASEVEALHGAVARVGSAHDIPTPVNRAVTEILVGMVHGEIDMEAYEGQPAKLLARVERHALEPGRREPQP